MSPSHNRLSSPKCRHYWYDTTIWLVATTLLILCSCTDDTSVIADNIDDGSSTVDEGHAGGGGAGSSNKTVNVTAGQGAGAQVELENTGGTDQTEAEEKDSSIEDLCGDGIITGDESCDQDSLGGETCLSLGFGDGPLTCTSFCKFDTGGCIDSPDAGNGDVVDVGQDTGLDVQQREDLGKGDGSDVICIGDSWMSLGASGIQQSLVRLSGQPYRTYGVPGTQLLNGQIPGQYNMAKASNPNILTVVMIAGGNDVIMNPVYSSACRNSTDQCVERLKQIADGHTELWNQMASDGVMDVIQIHYAQGAGSGTGTIDNAQYIKAACEAVQLPMRCHFLETTDIVNGQLRDGIHPTSAANDRIAQAIIEIMEREGIRR